MLSDAALNFLGKHQKHSSMVRGQVDIEADTDLVGRKRRILLRHPRRARKLEYRGMRRRLILWRKYLLIIHSTQASSWKSLKKNRAVADPQANISSETPFWRDSETNRSDLPTFLTMCQIRILRIQIKRVNSWPIISSRISPRDNPTRGINLRILMGSKAVKNKTRLRKNRRTKLANKKLRPRNPGWSPVIRIILLIQLRWSRFL